MRKSLSVVLAAALVVGAFAMPAEAKKKKKKKGPAKVEREATGDYSAPPLIIAGSCTQTGAIGCVTFATGPGETYVTAASVTDAHGLPVYVSVQADLNGDAQDDAVYGSFCGELEEPLVFDAGAELHFWVGLTPDPDVAGCVPAAATTGTMNITLSNLP